MTKVNLYRFDGGLTSVDVSDQIGQQLNSGTSGGFDIFKRKFGLAKLRIPKCLRYTKRRFRRTTFDAVKRLLRW